MYEIEPVAEIPSFNDFAKRYKEPKNELEALDTLESVLQDLEVYYTVEHYGYGYMEIKLSPYRKIGFSDIYEYLLIVKTKRTLRYFYTGSNKDYKEFKSFRELLKALFDNYEDVFYK